MKVLIASDDAAAAASLCRCLSQLQFHCEVVGTPSLEDSHRELTSRETGVNLVIVVLPKIWEESQRIIKTLRASTDAWIVPIGHLDAATDVIDLIQRGADGFVDQDRSLEPQLLAILENQQRHSGIDAKSNSQMIAIASASGGSGASTLAANLAVASAEATHRIGLFDFDLQKGDLAYLLDIKPRHSIVDLCRNKTLIDQSMLQQSVVSHECGVSLLAAPQSMGEMLHVEPGHLLRVLKLGRKLFSHCFVDFGSPANVVEHAELLEECDHLLIVLKLDFPGLCNTRRMLDLIDRRSIDSSRIQLVANRTGMTGDIPASKAKSILGRDIDHCVPCDEPVAHLAINCGVPLVQEAPKSAVAKAIRSLAATFFEEHPEVVTEQPEKSKQSGLSSSGQFLLQQVAGVMLLARSSG